MLIKVTIVDQEVIMKFLYLLMNFFIICGVCASEEISTQEGSICLEQNGKECKLNIDGSNINRKLVLTIKDGKIVNMTTVDSNNVFANCYVIRCERCGKIISTPVDGAGNGDIRYISYGLCDECAKSKRKFLCAN